jgi:hypothetical protein
MSSPSTSKQPELVCEVCNREPAVGVASSMAPISHAYGRRCLEMGADVFGTLITTWMCCDGHVHEYVLNTLMWDAEFEMYVRFGDYLNAHRAFFEAEMKRFWEDYARACAAQSISEEGPF